MNEIEFNLLDEGWLPVLYTDGHREEVSLRKAFADAHEIRTLVGDVPPQDAALYRLMLAVLYCVYGRRNADGEPEPIGDEGDAVRRWESVWARGRFDPGIIDAYLSTYHDRFYLFHPDRPFYQVNISKGTEYSAAKLNGALSESNNKVRLFSSVSGESKSGMGYPEAARWLLYLNAFDDTSSKPSVKNQGMPSTGAGWVGKLGYVMMIGRNLFETLMLNLVLTDHLGSPFPDGEPVWEKDVVSAEERIEVPLPGSPQEMLTLQDRRLLLLRKGDRVTGYRLLGGDIVPKENALVEQMTMWSAKDNVMVPRRHDPSRAMWRDFSAILMRSSDMGSGIHEPGVTRWVSLLLDEGVLDYSTVSVRATGVKYADKDFFVDDLVDDSITVNSSVLSRLGESVNERINRTVEKTDGCVRTFGRLASDIAHLNGLDDDRAKAESAKARAAGYAALDIPFRHWLASVGAEGADLEAQFNEWDDTMERILIREGRSMVRDAGTRALVGKIDENGRMWNGFAAFNAYRSRLLKEIHGDRNE